MKIKPNRQRLLEALKCMRDIGPDPYYSICNQMPSVEISRLCGDLLHEWPQRTQVKRGKSKMYPVSSRAKYRFECVSGTFWVNPRRHAALHWLITKLDQELNCE